MSAFEYSLPPSECAFVSCSMAFVCQSSRGPGSPFVPQEDPALVSSVVVHNTQYLRQTTRRHLSHVQGQSKQRQA